MVVFKKCTSKPSAKKPSAHRSVRGLIDQKECVKGLGRFPRTLFQKGSWVGGRGKAPRSDTLQLLPKLLVRSGDNGGVAEETLILGVLGACFHSGGDVAHVARDDDHALTAHTAGEAKLMNADLGGLDGNISGLDGGGGGVGLNDAHGALALGGLGTEQRSDDLLVDPSHN